MNKLIKLAQIANIPYKFRIYRPMPNPTSIRIQKGTSIVRINTKEQKKCINCFLKEQIDYPCILGIGSAPSDYLAMKAASHIVLNSIDKDNRFDVAYINAAKYGYNKYPKLTKCRVIYNVTENSTKLRWEIVRDLITDADESFVIVVMATKDIMETFNKLYIKPDYILYFNNGNKQI